MLGLTVLVIDRDAAARAETIRLLRCAGLHAVGGYVPTDAVALLEGLRTDVVLVRSDDEDEALEYLGGRTLLVRVAEHEEPAEAVAAVLELLGHTNAVAASAPN